ncbi:hypothetical protein OF390_09300, partial [Limosilactobacillus fermentum]|uniref:hypothetical protein n=1 Tax=Limosilactobacillus fermentum TaxID=1613 RepID=UPI0021E7B7E8
LWHNEVPFRFHKVLFRIYTNYTDITESGFPFGRTMTGFRMQCQTTNYNAIADLVSKMVVKGVESTSKLKGASEYQKSTDQSLLIVSPDFVIPSEILKMYQNVNSFSRITFNDAKNGVGRLADIVKAHQINLQYPQNCLR